MKPPVRVLASHSLHRGHVFEVVREKLEMTDNRVVERDIVVHRGAAVFIPQTDNGDLLLVRQYRQPLRTMLLEFPAGTLDEGEDGLTCARREIREEVGYEAAEWIDLGILYPAPGFCNEVQHGFLARNLTASTQALDEDEIIEVVTMPVPHVEQAIKAGEILDGKSIALFLRARLRGLF